MLTVRNRLSITKKCIQALYKHSKMKFQLYVYDNCTNYRLDEHFAYFFKLYEMGYVTQIAFGTKESNFNAFSKAVSSNLFALQHMQDPLKQKYNFLIILDNDIIVAPEWDHKIFLVWEDIKKKDLKNVYIVTQHPGGITNAVVLNWKPGGIEAVLGKGSGSGLWAVQTDFFEKIGLLKLSSLVGYNKKHDQFYWRLLEEKTHGERYVVGLRTILGYHCGRLVGSICNILSKNSANKDKLIKFENAEKEIDSMKFAEFYNKISSNKDFHKW